MGSEQVSDSEQVSGFWLYDQHVPCYGMYRGLPYKIVKTPNGRMTSWRLDPETGGWESVNHCIMEILFANYNIDLDTEEDYVEYPVSREEFILEVERLRDRHGHGDETIRVMYEAANAILAKAKAEGREPTPEEQEQEQELEFIIRRKTFVMFEEKLQREGHPGADPSVAD